MSAAPIHGVMADVLLRELGRLENIVGLCAFAVEARRIHNEIHWMATADAAFDHRLRELVEAHDNWAEMPDTVADVLCSVRDRMAELAGLMRGKPVGADMVAAPPQP